MHLHTIINKVFQSKTYILSTLKTREAWLIDCGDYQPIIEYITKNHLNLKGILITHSHFDHIYGLNEVKKYYPNAQIYISAKGGVGLYDEYQNLSKFNDHPWVYKFDNINIITEDTELHVLGNCLKIYYTPGHDISSLSFKINNFLFTGDSLIPGIKTFTNWPLSEKQKAIESEEKISKMVLYENLQIKAGH